MFKTNGQLMAAQKYKQNMQQPSTQGQGFLADLLGSGTLAGGYSGSHGSYGGGYGSGPMGSCFSIDICPDLILAAIAAAAAAAAFLIYQAIVTKGKRRRRGTEGFLYTLASLIPQFLYQGILYACLANLAFFLFFILYFHLYTVQCKRFLYISR